MANLTYNSELFDVLSMKLAREIILTPEAGHSTDERWASETPYLVDLIQDSMAITSDTILIDYGCGIGRVAKELIDRYGCRVIGVDISTNMQALALDYVRSPRFFACSPEMLDMLVERNFVADAAISVWVLQHCYRPSQDIDRIHRSLVSGGGLFVLNAVYRVVPTKEEGWVDDRIDIKSLLSGRFSLLREGKPLADKLPPNLRDDVFWSLFRKSD